VNYDSVGNKANIDENDLRTSVSRTSAPISWCRHMEGLEDGRALWWVARCVSISDILINDEAAPAGVAGPSGLHGAADLDRLVPA
jgi:hypothetical protein